jgi:hypothetical protein
MKATAKAEPKDLSGVYLMSGPRPAGNAPIRDQMEWGQGRFGRTWSGVHEPGMSVPPVTEIQVAQWPIFCAWCTKNFHGIPMSLERQNECNSYVEIRSQPFEELSARVENCVSTLSVVADAEPKKLCVEITGPLRLTLYRNPSGWPLLLEIEQTSGKAILHFAGEVEAGRALNGNAGSE